MISISEEESEAIRERLAKMKEENRLLGETKVAQIQAKMFRSWVALSITPLEVWCPEHKRMEPLVLKCGLNIELAISKLAEAIPEHAKEVKKEHEKIRRVLNKVRYW